MAMTDNLISFWELEEASGTRADSVTATGNDLEDVNTVTQATGVVGNAGLFTKSTAERLRHASNASLQTGDIDWTICLWFYMNSLGGSEWHTFVSKMATSNNEYLLHLSNAQRLMFYTMRADGITNTLIHPETTYTTGVWYFVIIWWDSVNSKAWMQVDNGTAVSADQTEALTAGTADFFIGARGDAGVNYPDARIDQVGFWKRVLTTDERTWLYNSGNGRSYAEMTVTPITVNLTSNLNG